MYISIIVNTKDQLSSTENPILPMNKPPGIKSGFYDLTNDSYISRPVEPSRYCRWDPEEELEILV